MFVTSSSWTWIPWVKNIWTQHSTCTVWQKDVNVLWCLVSLFSFSCILDCFHLGGIHTFFSCSSDGVGTSTPQIELCWQYMYSREDPAESIHEGDVRRGVRMDSLQSLIISRSFSHGMGTTKGFDWYGRWVFSTRLLYHRHWWPNCIDVWHPAVNRHRLNFYQWRVQLHHASSMLPCDWQFTPKLSNSLIKYVVKVYFLRLLFSSPIHSDMFVNGTCLNHGWTQDAAPWHDWFGSSLLVPLQPFKVEADWWQLWKVGLSKCLSNNIW